MKKARKSISNGKGEWIAMGLAIHGHNHNNVIELSTFLKLLLESSTNERGGK